MRRPPLLLRIYAFVMFAWSADWSLVWWWRMHVNTHQQDCAPGCPFAEDA